MTTNGGRTAPKPLTTAEVAGLWQGERRAMRFYVLAVTVVAAAFGLSSIGAQAVELRYMVLLLALALIVWALIVQFSIRCPRCNARLATQSVLLLPDHCRSCGVDIARPPSLDSELDV